MRVQAGTQGRAGGQKTHAANIGHRCSALNRLANRQVRALESRRGARRVAGCCGGTAVRAPERFRLLSANAPAGALRLPRAPRPTLVSVGSVRCEPGRRCRAVVGQVSESGCSRAHAAHARPGEHRLPARPHHRRCAVAAQLWDAQSDVRVGYAWGGWVDGPQNDLLTILKSKVGERTSTSLGRTSRSWRANLGIHPIAPFMEADMAIPRPLAHTTE